MTFIIINISSKLNEANLKWLQIQPALFSGDLRSLLLAFSTTKLKCWELLCHSKEQSDGFLSPEPLQQSPPDFCWGFSESIIRFYTCVQPVISPDEISGRYFLGSPGKGWDGAWLKCPIRKIAMVPSINSSAMTMKHILSITLATRNHSSFSCRARRKDDCNSDVNTSFSGIGRLNPNTNIYCSCVNERHIQPHVWRILEQPLTLWKSFWCLALSAMCLQEDTHCCTSGDAEAKLDSRSCAVFPSRPFSEVRPQKSKFKARNHLIKNVI